MYENNYTLNNGFNGQTVAPGAPEKPSGSKGVLAAIIVCAVCAVVAMGLGVFNSVRLSQIGQSLDKINADFYGDDVLELGDEAEKELICVLPESASDISYLMIGYNRGINQMFVDADNEISYYVLGANTDGEASSTEQTVQTDTSAIMQKVFGEGLDNYSERRSDIYDEEGELIWDWMVELGTKEGYVCQAGGTGDSPIWFDDLVEAADGKR